MKVADVAQTSPVPVSSAAESEQEPFMVDDITVYSSLPSMADKHSGLSVAVFCGFSYFKDIERVHATQLGAELRDAGINLVYGASDGGLMGSLLRGHQNLLHKDDEKRLQGAGQHKIETLSDKTFFENPSPKLVESLMKQGSEAEPVVPVPHAPEGAVVPEVRGVFPFGILDQNVIHSHFKLREKNPKIAQVGADPERPTVELASTMSERQSKIRSLADAVIILPGGPGAWLEFFETLEYVVRASTPGAPATDMYALDTKSKKKDTDDKVPETRIRSCKPIYILNTEGFYNDMLRFMASKKQIKFVNVYDTPQKLVAALRDNAGIAQYSPTKSSPVTNSQFDTTKAFGRASEDAKDVSKWSNMAAEGAFERYLDGK